MAVEMVEILNPNGRKGRVPATHPRFAHFKRPPSARYPNGDAAPAASASTEVWRSYAVSKGLPGDEAEAMTRGELVAHFTQTEEV